MNVLIVPTGEVAHCRNFVPMFIGYLRDAGDDNVCVRPLRDFGASCDGERQRAGLADAVERYLGNVQVFVRCLDDAVVSMADTVAPQDVRVRRRTFWGEDAWRNLGLWIREHFDPREPSWRAGVGTELEWTVQDSRHGHAASLIDIASREWLDRHEHPVDDAEEQRRLQAQVAPLVGSIHGGDPNRAEEASQRVRDILAKKHAG